MDGDPWMGGREGLCPRAKISNDSSPRFCKDMQRLCKHTCTHRASAHVRAHGALSTLHILFLSLMVTFFNLCACCFSLLCKFLLVKLDYLRIMCVSLTLFWILMASAPTHTTSSFVALAGDLGLRPAGAGDEVDRPVDVGASDVPHAPEHNAALCQTQSQD